MYIQTAGCIKTSYENVPCGEYQITVFSAKGRAWKQILSLGVTRTTCAKGWKINDHLGLKVSVTDGTRINFCHEINIYFYNKKLHLMDQKGSFHLEM